jgi:flagellar hook-length control protein FliK
MTMTIHRAASTQNSTAADGIAPAGSRPAGDDLSSTSRAAAPAPTPRGHTAGSTANATANTSAGAKSAAPAAPLFANMLGATGGAARATEPAPAADDDRSDQPDTGDTGALLPAMAGSLFTAAMPAPAPATPFTVQGKAPGAADSTTDDHATLQGARGDALAVSTLYPSATPFNLSAVGIAVNTATGAAPVARYDASQDANQLALAQQAQRLTDGAMAPALVVTTPTVAPAPQSDAKPLATTAEPLTANPAHAAAMALAATAAAATPVVAARPVPTASASTSKPAAVASAVADLALPRVAVRVAAAPVDADAASASASASASANSAASLAGAAGDDRQGTGKFASALAGTANTAPAGLVAGAPSANAANAAVVKLAGAPEQWQQPLRDALGDRLQVNLQRNNDHAVIRLDPPNMGSIEISIRHTAGALQVNLSASNSEVVRQLNNIGDSVRQDLSNRQFTEVAVTVSSARAQAQGQADGGRQQREQQEQERQRTPGRALYGDDAVNTFAMNDQE